MNWCRPSTFSHQMQRQSQFCCASNIHIVDTTALLWYVGVLGIDFVLKGDVDCRIIGIFFSMVIYQVRVKPREIELFLKFHDFLKQFRFFPIYSDFFRFFEKIYLIFSQKRNLNFVASELDSLSTLRKIIFSVIRVSFLWM
jgi:hypothetical protein